MNRLKEKTYEPTQVVLAVHTLEGVDEETREPRWTPKPSKWWNNEKGISNRPVAFVAKEDSDMMLIEGQQLSNVRPNQPCKKFFIVLREKGGKPVLSFEAFTEIKALQEWYLVEPQMYIPGAIWAWAGFQEWEDALRAAGFPRKL